MKISKLFFFTTLIFFSIYGILYAESYTKEEICSAIYIIEGKEKARQPFGIETIECKTFKRCRQICWNTVENNRKRYADYGYKKFNTYLKFLASRYCPLSCDGCKNWLSNLLFYLNKKRKE